MQRDLKAALDGTVAGTIAAVPMSVLMIASRQSGAMPSYPPQDLTEAALDAVDVPPGKLGIANEGLAIAAHFGFGATSGALFNVLHRRLRLPIPAVLHGVIFGTLVWWVSYMGWVPALEVLPSAEKDHRGRALTTLLAHWIFGATLGFLVERSASLPDEE